jgi:hypothetical protein
VKERDAVPDMVGECDLDPGEELILVNKYLLLSNNSGSE